VDPVDAVPSGDRFETFDVNRWFVVARDDEGFAVWRLEELGEGEPIGRFADDDRGYDLGRLRSGRSSRRRTAASGVPGSIFYGS
jgi:hypothetical protein